MALDITGLLLLLLFFIYGYRKGFFVAIFSVAGLLLGIMAALKLAGKLAIFVVLRGWITSGWSLLVAYLVLFLGVWLLVRLIGSAFSRFTSLIMLKWVDGSIGGMLFAALGAIFWSSVLWILHRMHAVGPEITSASRTYPYFEPVAPWVFAHVGMIVPYVSNTFDMLEALFEQINKKLSGHVGAH